MNYVPTAPECTDPNSSFQDNTPVNPVACTDPIPEPGMTGLPGCTCNDGYVRSIGGKCIPKSEVSQSQNSECTFRGRVIEEPNIQ